MSEQVREATRDLGDLLELVVKSMSAIVIVYLIAKALLPLVVGSGLATNIISAILGIAFLFSVVVSKRVRNEILAFGANKNK